MRSRESRERLEELNSSLAGVLSQIGESNAANKSEIEKAVQRTRELADGVKTDLAAREERLRTLGARVVDIAKSAAKKGLGIPV